MTTEPRTSTATVSGPVTGGRGWPFGSPADADWYGYVIEEFLLDGRYVDDVFMARSLC